MAVSFAVVRVWAIGQSGPTGALQRRFRCIPSGRPASGMCSVPAFSRRRMSHSMIAATARSGRPPTMPVHKGPTKGLPPESENSVTPLVVPFAAPCPMARQTWSRVRDVT